MEYLKIPKAYGIMSLGKKDMSAHVAQRKGLSVNTDF